MEQFIRQFTYSQSPIQSCHMSESVNFKYHQRYDILIKLLALFTKKSPNMNWILRMFHFFLDNWKHLNFEFRDIMTLCVDKT